MIPCKKTEIVINEILVDKLRSISHDIKYYLNVNAAIGFGGNTSLKYMDEEDYIELLSIRGQLKKLTSKVENKLKPSHFRGPIND